MISFASVACATDRATPSQFLSRLNFTPGGLAMPATGYHVQSVPSPPILSDAGWLGERFLSSWINTGFGERGFVPP